MINDEPIVEIEQYLALEWASLKKISFFFIQLSQRYHLHGSTISSMEIYQLIFGFTGEFKNPRKMFFSMV